jgi:tripartite-type tricarboxylate transporter receptor subunit TctC
LSHRVFAMLAVSCGRILADTLRRYEALLRADPLARTMRLGALAALSLLAGAATGQAQDYPARPIRAIVGAAAGGGSDVFLRVLGEELYKRLGQPIIVENRPGGAFNIAARACSEAPPDGYTLCMLPNDPLVYNQFLFKNLQFDPENGFTPITKLFHLTHVLVVNPSLNVKTIPELIALAKQKPATLSYGTFPLPLALYLEKLKRENGIDWVRVPFRGGGEMANAVLSGSTPIAFLGMSNVMPQLQGGLMTPLAIDGDARSPLFPDVPTLTETGHHDKPLRSWFGLFAPAGTPEAIVRKLATAVTRIVDDPGFRQRNLVSLGLEPAVNEPGDFARSIRQERPLAQNIVKEAGLQPQ